MTAMENVLARRARVIVVRDLCELSGGGCEASPNQWC